MKLEWTAETPQPPKVENCCVLVWRSRGAPNGDEPKLDDLPHILRLIPPEVMQAEGWSKEVPECSGCIDYAKQCPQQYDDGACRDGCALHAGHVGTHVSHSGAVRWETGKAAELCCKTAGCTLPGGHDQECVPRRPQSEQQRAEAWDEWSAWAAKQNGTLTDDQLIEIAGKAMGCTHRSKEFDARGLREVFDAGRCTKGDESIRHNIASLEKGYAISKAIARLTTIIDEAFGLQPPTEDKNLDALLTTLEARLSEKTVGMYERLSLAQVLKLTRDEDDNAVKLPGWQALLDSVRVLVADKQSKAGAQAEATFYKSQAEAAGEKLHELEDKLRKAEKDASRTPKLRDQIARQREHIESLQATITERNERIRQLESEREKTPEPVDVLDIAPAVKETCETAAAPSVDSARQAYHEAVKRACGQGRQHCHECPELKCGDNDSPATEVAKLEVQLAALRSEAEAARDRENSLLAQLHKSVARNVKIFSQERERSRQIASELQRLEQKVANALAIFHCSPGEDLEECCRRQELRAKEAEGQIADMAQQCAECPQKRFQRAEKALEEESKYNRGCTHARDKWREKYLQTKAELVATCREADRLRHGNTIEGDFVCPNEDARRKAELQARVMIEVMYQTKASEQDWQKIASERDERARVTEARIADMAEALRLVDENIKATITPTDTLTPEVRDKLLQGTRSLIAETLGKWYKQ